MAITGGGTGLTYQPAAGYCSTDSFTYTLNGGSTATVAVTVSCVDIPPVAVNDTATVTEDSGATSINVLANDTNPDGGPKTILSVTQPAHGTVAITGGGTGLTYTPNANYCNNGSPTDNFTYTLNGGSTATVAVTVTCVDDNPVAVNDTATVAEDSGATSINVLANDTDIDGGPKTIVSVTQPAHGTVVITGGGTGLTYTPNPNYCNNGSPTDSFSYTLNGGSTANVRVTVTCVDDPPVAVNDTASVPRASGPNPINVLANDTDIDGGPKTITSVTQPAHGTVVITGGGTGLTYQPARRLLQRRQPDRQLHLHPERRLHRDRGGDRALHDPGHFRQRRDHGHSRRRRDRRRRRQRHRERRRRQRCDHWRGWQGHPERRGWQRHPERRGRQ